MHTNDEYNYRDGGKEVLNDTLEAWTCGGAINGPYAAYCQDTAYGYALINVDTMWGTFEQAQSYGLWGDVYVEGVSEATSINATITGDLFMMPAGPLAFAATFEDSDTNYNIDPGPQYDAGNVWGTTRTSGGGERTRTSYALEFSVPITTSFGIQLASRYDDYDELSTAIGGKRTDKFHSNGMLVRTLW